MFEIKSDIFDRQVPRSIFPSSRSSEMFTLLDTPDYFLANPPLQPKKDIAQYVASEGFAIPKIFSDVEEALRFVKAGGKIMIRSEHPQEYSWAAGLLTSYLVDKSVLEALHKGDSLKAGLYGALKSFFKHRNQKDFEEQLKIWDRKSIEKFCSLLKVNREDFTEKISYSYWEALEGNNGILVADSALKDRYHLFIKEEGDENEILNYFVFEDGKWTSGSSNKENLSSSDEKKENLSQITFSCLEGVEWENLICFYEELRSLNAFDPKHCPILEFQHSNNKNYFLQYHRTRNQKLADFTLERPLELWEIQAQFVRGATPPEWIILQTTISPYPNYEIFEEEASFDMHYQNLFASIMNKQRKVAFLEWQMEEMIFKCASAHFTTNRIFDPELFVLIDEIPKEVLQKVYAYWKIKKELVQVPVRLISDGKKAYVKFL